MGCRKNLKQKMKAQPLFKSFKHAFSGMVSFFEKDRNGKIHRLATLGVIIAGFYFKISNSEWAILLLCIALVLGFEMMNHSLEKLCDIIHIDQHPLIKTAKDISAGAVLWAAIISAIIGLLIFVPKLLPTP